MLVTFSLALSAKDHILTAAASAAVLVYGLSGPHINPMWRLGNIAVLSFVLAADIREPNGHSPLVAFASIYL